MGVPVGGAAATNSMSWMTRSLPLTLLVEDWAMAGGLRELGHQSEKATE